MTMPGMIMNFLFIVVVMLTQAWSISFAALIRVARKLKEARGIQFSGPLPRITHAGLSD
jgi:hypothetical protein